MHLKIKSSLPVRSIISIMHIAKICITLSVHFPTNMNENWCKFEVNLRVHKAFTSCQ